MVSRIVSGHSIRRTAQHGGQVQKKPSAEYDAFDRMIGDLLSVPKAELDARVKAHKERAALNPNKRGPKPKIKVSSADARDAG